MYKFVCLVLILRVCHTHFLCTKIAAKKPKEKCQYNNKINQDTVQVCLSAPLFLKMKKQIQNIRYVLFLT